MFHAVCMLNACCRVYTFYFPQPAGGQFVIGTKSRTTGTVVLRHEMGHNFIDVGEEYDGGE